LDALPSDERARLAPLLTSVELTAESALVTAGSAPPVVYFPLDCLIAMRAPWAGRTSVELGLIGPEGAAGAWVVLGDARAPHDLATAKTGSALAADTTALTKLLPDTPQLRAALFARVHQQLADLSAAAATHAFGSLPERLAARLDERFTRMSRSQIEITHAELSRVLGVPRPGVTVALQMLEGRRAIRSRRGLIELVDRSALLGAPPHRT
jgi:hypothetical protein